MRVVAGEYRGLKLKTIEGRDIRPTLDRVKEAVFSMVESHAVKGTFLDLFSGSGSLGIEALSRGFFHVTFVEKNRTHAAVLRENLSKIKRTNYTVRISDYRDAVSFFQREGQTFDVIYLDPPFEKNFVKECLTLLRESNILTEEGIILLEHSSSEPLPEEFQEAVLKEKKYGSILITILRRISTL